MKNRTLYAYAVRSATTRDDQTLAIVCTSGKKADGISLDMTRLSVERWRRNPVILRSHNLAEFPIGRADPIEVKRDVCEALITWDMSDPHGAMAAHKFNSDPPFLNAFSISFESMSSDGMPTRVSRKPFAYHEIYEASVVSVPLDISSVAVRGYDLAIPRARDRAAERAEIARLVHQLFS